MKLHTILGTIALLLLGNFLYGYSEWSTESQGTFSHVVREGIPVDRNPLIKDIALLGAHDAFSHEIHLFSEVDPAESPTSLVNNPWLRGLLGGVFVRYAKAQTVGTEILLQRGVRYFDIRVSWVEDQWMTKHGLVSGSLNKYLLPLVQFLSENPGEFVILDFQHVYLGDQTYEELFLAIDAIRYENQSLWDSVNYSTHIRMDELTYEDITLNRTKAGVVFLFNTLGSESQNRHYDRRDETVIRSTWHDTPSLPTLFERIEEEHTFIQSLPERPFLSVNQAQRTGQFSSEGILDTLLGWSLISMAKEGNARLLQHEHWLEWWTTMPILMVDFATSNEGQFNVLVNEAIIAYNLTL